MKEVEVRNHLALKEALVSYRSNVEIQPRRIMLLSPSVRDVAFLRAQFPSARFYVATIDSWDLNHSFPSSGTVDLVVASNVFHYSPVPAVWFRNVLRMTRTFVLQDLVFRRRSARGELCEDGDAMRYSYRARGVHAEHPRAYDLGEVDGDIEYFATYEGGLNEHHAPPSLPPVHYCAVIESREAMRSPLAWPMANYARFRIAWMRMAAAAMLRRPLPPPGIHARGAGHPSARPVLSMGLTESVTSGAPSRFSARRR